MSGRGADIPYTLLVRLDQLRDLSCELVNLGLAQFEEQRQYHSL